MSGSKRHAAREALSFLAVGAAGFLVEAVILTALTSWLEWSPWHARVPSFFAAVLITWSLNRRHTFAGRGMRRRSLEAVLYTTIQGGGALVNLAIFAVALTAWPDLTRLPVIALALGAGGGFVFNYLMSSKLLYSQRRSAALAGD